MNFKHIYYIAWFILIGNVLLFGYVFSYLENYIPWGQSSSGDSTYQGQKIHTISGSLLLSDTWQDDIMAWDTLQGDYFDSMFGVFQVDSGNWGVEVLPDSTLKCLDNTTHDGYKLSGYSYNSNFGFVNFNFDADNYVYICISNQIVESTIQWYLGWYAYSPYIWFQNFDGITFEVESDQSWISGSGVLITGNTNSVRASLQDSVRLTGDVDKSTMRANILKTLFSRVRNVALNNGSQVISSQDLTSSVWSWNNGAIISWWKGLYFWGWTEDTVTIQWTTTLNWNKTVVVEWKNIYISWDIRGAGLLWIIALEKEWKGWNIYIDPNVTDIHAFMYADKSVLNYSSAIWEYDGDTLDDDLRNQLYIKWSVFSENTILVGVNTLCPYYINVTDCNKDVSKKYNFNYLRRYALTPLLDGDGNPTTVLTPKSWWAESYMWDANRSNSPWNFRSYSVIIDYNPMIQISPPLFFE